MGGDAIEIDLTAGAGTRTLLGTQASTKAYRTASLPCRQSLAARLEGDAVLVVDRENDQAATVVVTVHDLLILHSGRPRAGDLRSGSADYGDCETA